MGEIEKYTLIVDRELFRKFRYISDWEGRSANKELAVIVRRYIEVFESRHARLNFDTEREHMNQKHTLRKSLCVFLILHYRYSLKIMPAVQWYKSFWGQSPH